LRARGFVGQPGLRAARLRAARLRAARLRAARLRAASSPRVFGWFPKFHGPLRVLLAVADAFSATALYCTAVRHGGA
jgi:hypothetical protein